MGHLEENQPTPSLFVVRVELAYLYERLHRAEMYAPPEGGREGGLGGRMEKEGSRSSCVVIQAVLACMPAQCAGDGGRRVSGSLGALYSARE